MKRLRDGARTEGEELLTRVLDECLEEDLSFVPHEREIAGKHRFSPGFAIKSGRTGIRSQRSSGCT